jgi:transposase InsO family protein
MKGEHPVRVLCEVLGVAVSGYYRWRIKPRSARAIEDERLAEQIVEVHRNSRRTYGAPRIVRELEAAGVRISRRRCARLMRARAIRGRKQHRRIPRTTDSAHGRATPGNRLVRGSAPAGPNQIWVTDITYLRTDEGWLYLAAILDLWSRRVVGWSCGPSLAASLAIAALRHALRERQPPRGLIHHSDRGSQYVDDHYVKILEAYGITRSMSRVANCYDNAFIESFWSTLKSDTGLDTRVAPSRAAAELAVFDYIETFYNPTRRHSSLGYISPVAFEKIN